MKPTIVYIGGYGRSGSTLLDRVLGELPEVISLGEVRHIWQRAFRENQWVSNQVPFRECPFWTAVVEKAFGGFDGVDIDRVDELRSTHDRLRAMPKLRSLKKQNAAFQERTKEFGVLLKQLYGSISDVSGAPVLIDSSKHPCYAYLLHATGHFDLKVIHIVRDARATAYSWQRKRERPEIYWKKEEMPRFSPSTSSLHWCAANALMESLKGMLPDAYYLLKYEDFVSEPIVEIERMWQRFGLSKPSLTALEGNTITLGQGYTIAGNPFRFKMGPVAIGLDEEWKSQMRPATRRLVSLLSCPYLLKYGYFSSRK